MNNLVIVESPTKARTLSRFLGPDYRIEASMGHVRDLPKSELGVDVDKGFEPKYIVPRDKKKKVNELVKLARGVQKLWLATDPDREGEAIAWHLARIVDRKGADTERVEFHEITEEAVKAAFARPRQINMRLVDAQQARRVLDRLVGYKLSPLLWRKVKRGLSAGRVQTVVLRLIVEREREIEAFKPVESWSIEAELETTPPARNVVFAQLIEQNGKKLEIKDKAQADSLLEMLDRASYKVDKVSRRELRRFPPPPFTTSTLQQTAGNRLGYTAKKTMVLSQHLYEQGLITYMRTDSVNLSAQALSATRDLISSQFGKEYLPRSARAFRSKSKNAQEAHEAIRPTNIRLAPNQFNPDGLTGDHKRLYELIWKRMIACQMAEAVLNQTTVDVAAQVRDDRFLLRASGSVLKFDGWLKIHGVKQELDEESGQDGEGRKQVLPELKKEEPLNLLQLLPEQHFTQPPPRYSEASLIKKLEELGIGRPSTYAPILSTIQERYYVEREERKFKPTALGLATNDFLVKYFPDLFDYSFTALMEDRLDDVARGEGIWQETVKSFYDPLEKILERVEESAQRVDVAVETVDKQCPECGRQLIVRTGKFGKFLACPGFPDCKYTEKLEEETGAGCPTDGGRVVVRKTKKGRTFYGCSNYPNCDFVSWTKPKARGKEVAIQHNIKD